MRTPYFGEHHISYSDRVERWAGHAGWPPDHASLAISIPNYLFWYLIGSLIRQCRCEHEDNLVLNSPVPVKDVLQHSRQPHFGERLPDLFAELAVHCGQGVFAEFDMTAERPVKRRPRRGDASEPAGGWYTWEDFSV
jgi:hypothetical protein